MSADPIFIQTALTIPMALGLVVYTLVRWDRSILHLFLAALLTGVILWLGGTVLKLSDGPDWLRLAGLDLEIGAIIFLPTLFLATMGHFARSAWFENTPASVLGLLSVSAVFLVAHLTDGHHHLMIADRATAMAGGPEGSWAGPAYWALQAWGALLSLGGIAYATSVLRKGRNSDERGRAAMILAAVALPMLAHAAYMLEWLPIDYSLAPGAIAVTAAFFVQGVHRYGLLDAQTIVRHDMIEHIDAGLVLADEYGTVVDANRAAEDLLGIEREAMRGMALPAALALLEPEVTPCDFAEKLVALPLDGRRIEAVILTSDDRIIEVAGGGMPTLGAQPAGRFVSLVDRTAQRRSERMLRERQKMESVGVLAAGVAHEVNNPLAYVRSNLVHLRSIVEALPKQTDLDAAADVDEMPEVIAESIEGLDRIARIVESMLRFSRASDETLRPVDIGEVVEEALRLAALRHSQGVRVERLGGAVPHVLGNSARLVQVLLNLFLNAKHALADRGEGTIQAETTTEGDHVLVRIRDDGPGIPDEIQQRIFDPFFTTRAPDTGTALGLSIAFDIVREHGGTLEVSSRVGEGACFTVRLAAAPGEPKPAPTGQAPS